MPLVDVTLTEGRDPAQVRALIHALHAAVHDTVGARPEHIRVIVREVPRTHWATGDVTVAEMHTTATKEQK
ncbi:4-oxalocrotonate tautomerase [Nocardioides dongxiaopingii]|uniref:tautomerase family protein n=1 Tax=Nocardioides sp. S-1144 TaxID=2582905 RepID=UPI00110E1718|nr:tautomerase family protein [Nocardioides sp. S-1144]QCW51643.1 4-oxalocrotonate tautomerase [Nocardioides sp. S-1144]